MRAFNSARLSFNLYLGGREADAPGTNMIIDDSNLMTVWLNVFYLLSRYVHIVSAMLLVGGLLFYEAVMPSAISDLQDSSQIAVYARARWFFRRIIFFAIAGIVLSGIFMTVWRMQTYISTEFLPRPGSSLGRDTVPWSLRTGWWWAAHVVSAAFAILVALHVLTGDRPLKSPVDWLRLDLMLLLIVVFFATVTRQVDQLHMERSRALMNPAYLPYFHTSSDFGPPTSSEPEQSPPQSSPSTAPAP